MYKKILLAIFIAAVVQSVKCKAQDIVTNWDMDENFKYTCAFDLDINKRTTNLIDGCYEVLVQINSSGTGRFIWYDDCEKLRKHILYIQNAKRLRDEQGRVKSIEVHCINDNDFKVPCTIVFEILKDGYLSISQVWMINTNSNIAVVYLDN